MAFMILVTRRCIILLLLVLQGFAPLVHAHVHTVGGEEGIHVHGITTVASHEHQLSTLDNFSCSNAAVGVQSAISKKKALQTAPDADTCFVSYADFVQPPVLIAKYIGFSPSGFALQYSLLLSDSAPRAPPL